MLISNEPNAAARQAGAYTAFLNSQGRVLNDAFIYPLPGSDGDGEPGWLIEIDKNEVMRLMRHLKRHKLRSKLKLRALEDGERTVWSSWNDDHPTPPKWAVHSLVKPTPPSFLTTGCVDTRAPGFGSRFITPGSDDLRVYVSDGVGDEVDFDAYTVRRMLHGIAEGQDEIIREHALPLECNLDVMRGVDFRKGCYIGQELTIRTHHTGVIRKRILPVQLYSSTLPNADTPKDIDGNSSGMPVYSSSSDLPLPPPGTNISRAGGRRGRSAGKFLAGIGNIGLALCRLEMMTDITLTGEGSQYSREHEFKVSWNAAEEDEAASSSLPSTEVNVEAFVPPWTREYILYGGVRKNRPLVNDVEGPRAKNMVEQLEEEAAQKQVE